MISQNYRINLVQLRELRNDNNMYSELAPLWPLSALRNRDRQDVESVMQISNPSVRKIIQQNAQTVTHTVVPEKYRLTDDHKRGVFKTRFGSCMGSSRHVFVTML